jgi:hypothetical protein
MTYRIALKTEHVFTSMKQLATGQEAGKRKEKMKQLQDLAGKEILF